jgi:hypothetical protein
MKSSAGSRCSFAEGGDMFGSGAQRPDSGPAVHMSTNDHAGRATSHPALWMLAKLMAPRGHPEHSRGSRRVSPATTPLHQRECFTKAIDAAIPLARRGEHDARLTYRAQHVRDEVRISTSRVHPMRRRTIRSADFRDFVGKGSRSAAMSTPAERARDSRRDGALRLTPTGGGMTSMARSRR